MRTFRLSVVTAHPALTQARTAWCVTFRFRVTCSLALFLPLSGPPGVRCLFFLPYTLSEGQISFSGFWVILPQIRLTLVWNVVSQSSFLANSKNGTHSLWAWKRNREKSKMIPRLLGRMVVIISPSQLRNQEFCFGYFQFETTAPSSSGYLRRPLNREVSERGPERGHGCRQNLLTLGM